MMDEGTKKLHLAAAKRIGEKLGEHRVCGKKIAFETEEKAIRAMNHHNKWEGRNHDVEHYPCPFCEKWHIGCIMPEDVMKEIAEKADEE